MANSNNSNLFDLTGKTALVTGVSRGLGQYLARALAEAGSDLIITSRNKTDCESFAEEIRRSGRTVFTYSLDVRKEQSIQNLRDKVRAECPPVDILVNNAGCNIRKLSLEITWDDWNTVLDTNLRGMFFLCKEFGRPMIERKSGKIINIGSVTCVFGYAGLVPYSASRGGVMQLTKALADEWGPFGINVNVLAPGWFRTLQNEALYQNEEWYEYICDRIPLKRPGIPHDLDGAVVFLASDASRYVTGQVLLVDGGVTTGSTKAILEKGV
jgi:gluconate 5-dehydrogenase